MGERAAMSFTTYRDDESPPGCGPRVDRTVCNWCGWEAYAVHVTPKQDAHLGRCAPPDEAVAGDGT